MNRFRAWLSDKVASLSYRLESAARRLQSYESSIRPKLRYEDMDEFQKRCHDDSNRIAETIADYVVPEKSPWEGLINKDDPAADHIRSVFAERPLA